MLHLDDQVIHEFDRLKKTVVGDTGGRFESSVQPGVLAGPQQRNGKVLLGKSLAARERDPAPGIPVEGSVLGHFVHHLLHRHVDPVETDRLAGADVGTLSAQGAAFAVDDEPVLRQREAPFGTAPDT